MAGGCPGYGSGATVKGGTNPTRSVATTTKMTAQTKLNGSDTRFRDVSSCSESARAGAHVDYALHNFSLTYYFIVR